MDSIPGLGRSTGERKGFPLQYSGLENSMDCIVHGVPKSWTQLSDFHFHFSLVQNTTGRRQLPRPGNQESLQELARQMVRATVFQRGKCHTLGVLIQGKSAPPRGTHVTMSSYIFACHSGGRCTGYWHLVGGSHTEQPQQQRFIHPKGVTRRCACLCFSIFPYNSCPKFQ